MLTNEKIAHDLAIVYLSNRYGVHLDNNFRIRGGDSLAVEVALARSFHIDNVRAPIAQQLQSKWSLREMGKAQNLYAI